ncbi:uncharacterized protein MEPE_06061 [Melanopsichium pennsylvanicum]|uniref:RRM Nup35-type domain-containing protein n=2 Tax=Melanopsichium pennsylvanicum TaxID=63383 RepID=A0AAJ4XSZ6_9BASI|nr:putative protein [Melanopsichium pennsylvanicum 4]SNX87351.1 uncharacterized protein MEPE_06061 [Melanopsichium pennsylvanicum]
MFSFSNLATTPQQGAQQQQQPIQPQSSTLFGSNVAGVTNSFGTSGGLSFGNNTSNNAQQQQQPHQQQQGTPQSAGLFGQKPFFGTPSSDQPQQQQQQQQKAGSFFGSNATGTPGQSAQPPTNLSGTPQNNSLFGSSASAGFWQQQQQQQQQQQPQPTGQQQSSQPNAFGQGNFGGHSSSSPTPLQSQQSQSFGSPFHQQSLQQNVMQHGTPQSSQHQHFQQQNQHQQQQQQAIDQQRYNLEQQSQNMNYIPGYLSRTKVVKPYKLHARQTEPTSPEAVQDADSSIAFGTPASKSGKEESTPSSKGQPSPVGRFSSSFFNERRDDPSFGRAGSVGPATPWRGGRESIFGAGGLRGGRQSATPAPASSITGTSATPARKTSMDSPACSIRSNSTPPTASTSFNVTHGAMEEEEDDDAPPQERLEDETPAAIPSTFLGSSSGSANVYGNSFRSSTGADSTDAQRLASGRTALSTPSNGMQRLSSSTGASSTSTEASSVSARGDASSEKNSLLGSAQRTVLVYGYPTWMEKIILEVFATIGGVELIEAIDLTGSGSAQEQAANQPSSPQLSCCTRIRYIESFQALHALRRNGEVVAGACMVGVRWEDDNFHQVALTNGIDAVFRMDVFPSNRTAQSFRASSKSIAVPSIDAAMGASALSARASNVGSSTNGNSAQENRHSISFGQSVSARNENASSSNQGAASSSNNVAYPAFGRPLSVINDPSVTFKHSASTSNASGLAGSPFKAASSLFGTGAATTSKFAAPVGGDEKPVQGSSGVFGRITDGIFGW